MNTCKSCKHWGNGWPINESKPNECGYISLCAASSEEPAFIDADATDDSGLYAKLMTVAAFGCVLHTVK